MTQLVIMGLYLALVLGLGLVTNRLFRGTSQDFFVASRSIGPVMLLMSLFGTSMTAFALVGSSGEAYRGGIGVFGTLASWSAIVHTGVFLLIGVPLWVLGKRHGYVTQIQFFRDRFESQAIGWLLFPVLVGLVIPYLLTGLLGAGGVVRALTREAFPAAGGMAPAVTSFVICLVVLSYVFFGGLRAAAWANTLQAFVFIVAGVIAFTLIASKLGGAEAATEAVLAAHPERLVRGEEYSHLQFLTYGLIPLSAAMFPHLFQHWLTARSAQSFKLTIAAHPVLIMILWVPTVMIGVWATAAALPDGSLVVPLDHAPNTELATMVEALTEPLIGGLLGAGILAAIMSSLDSQFLALGSIFANDVVAPLRHGTISDRSRLALGRGFVVAVVAVTYLLSLGEPRAVFAMGIWCFSGFTGLFPLLCGALYWRGVTKAGGMASIAVAGVVWFALFHASGYGAEGGYLFMGLMPVLTIFLSSAVTLVGVSLFTKPPSRATLRKFFPEAKCA